MDIARKSWELDNNVKLVDPARDALYRYDADAHKALCDKRPWASNPHHFKHVRISAVALIKMVMHARSGGSLEVMGLMQGFVDGDTFVVTDAFRLPVEGTETRVNAQGEANEYLIEYLELCRAQGRHENVVGWYHSHPGYGCWLSGIDVDTQALQQQYQEPFLAVVVDPDRTINAGKVEIGAFRTYPADYKPSGPAGSATDPDGFQAVPLSKAADFGAHASRYYALEVSHYKSTLDARLLELLWHKYWVQTLSASPLLTNRDFGSKRLLDLASKIADVTGAMSRAGRRGTGLGMGLGMGLGGGGGGGGSAAQKGVDDLFEKVAKDSRMVATGERTGLMATQVKARIFNGGGTAASKDVDMTSP